MRIPKLINDKDEMNVKPKDDDDQMMGRKDDEMKGPGKNGKEGVGRQMINANIDWSLYIKKFVRQPADSFGENTEKEKLVDSISKILLQTKSGVSNDIIKQYADAGSRESFIKTATIQIMSTPEYQLC
jgi:hypothetical protein